MGARKQVRIEGELEGSVHRGIEILRRAKEPPVAEGATVDEMVCPVCRRRIFSCSDTAVRLKTRILIFENSGTIAKCKYCRNDVVVPVVMSGAIEERSLPLWDEDRDGSVE